jgi:hypothetical protein
MLQDEWLRISTLVSHGSSRVGLEDHGGKRGRVFSSIYSCCAKGKTVGRWRARELPVTRV